MKGLIAVLFSFIVLTLQAEASVKARNLRAIKLTNGEIIAKLSLQESTKVLKSLERDANIEIRSRVIYPEEVSELIVSKLTKEALTEKRPNPQDYN